MAKNMTRKGLAFGAAIALGVTGISSIPANAAGMPDNTLVSLAANSGTALTVFTDSVFDLKANFASAVLGSGKDLKFRITDTADLIKFDVSHDSATDTAQTYTVSHFTDFAITDGTGTAEDTITFTAAADYTAEIAAGDVFTITTFAGTTTSSAVVTASIVNGERVVSAVTASTVAIKVPAGSFAADAAASVNAVTAINAVEQTLKSTLDSRADLLVAPLAAAGVISSVATATDTRSTDDFIVVDVEEDDNAADIVLRLVADTAETYSATVTAWIDNNNNNKIDATEYASPDRVVTFQKASTIVPTLTWTPINVGDATATATVATSPKINFDMVGDSAFTVDFMRQGSALTTATAGYSESWDDLTGLYTVTQILNNTTSADNWNDITLAADATGTFTQAGTVVTVVSVNNYTVNDIISVTTAGVATNKPVLSATATGFTYTADASATSASATFTDSTSTTQKYAFAVAGTYKATVKVGTSPAKIGSTFELAAGTAVAAAIANKATVTSDVNSTFKVRKGYTGAVTVTTTIKDSLAAVVGAGVPVTIAASETSAGTIVVNGVTVTTSKSIATSTDANGQVVITVTNSVATAGDTVTLNVTSQGFSDSDVLTWEAPTYLLTDEKDSATVKLLGRSILSGGTASFDIVVKDQFNTHLPTEARVKVALAGTRWSATSYQTITGGKATINVVDTPVAVATLTATATFTLQQKNTAGSWVDANGTAPTVAMTNSNAEINGEAVTVTIRSANGSSVTLNANAVASADLAVASATTVTSASDTRNAETAADFSAETDPMATITGTVKDGFTGVGQNGASVTISGDSSILFRAGTLSSFGSITVFASASDGTFSVAAYSNKAQINSVVTATSNGASTTTKVTFGVAAVTTGTSLVLTAPTSALPGSTMTLKAKLTDKFGNAVTVTDTADIKVTYVGPGIVFGSLPQVTDINGELSVAVLLGSNDSGTGTFTVSYDRSSDGDFTGTTAADLDLVATTTLTVGAVASATKVNAGSFLGYVAVYAKGHEGSEISWKIAGKWFKTTVTSDYQVFQRKTVDVGVDVNVDIYITAPGASAVKLLTKVVATR